MSSFLPIIYAAACLVIPCLVAPPTEKALYDESIEMAATWMREGERSERVLHVLADGLDPIGVGERILERLLSMRETRADLREMLLLLNRAHLFRGSDAEEYGRKTGSIAGVRRCWNSIIDPVRHARAQAARRQPTQVLPSLKGG